MNKEIKEILGRLDFNEWEVDLYKVPITWCEMYDIRDYITNLQEERDDYKHKFWEEQELNEYLQQRIDEAIEYMKKWGEEPDADMYVQMKEYKEFQYLLNILQGKSDE